jgi:hypothetical protein
VNLRCLPPKRFQDPQDPYYDPIRHEPWFHKLMKRRAQNAMLKAAHWHWVETDDQKLSASLHGVDPRELRDYTNWVNKTPRKAVSAQEQAILDGAYEVYTNPDPSFKSHTQSFGWCIRHVASLFGVKGRPIEEMWEIRHDFWPTGYPIRNERNE